MEFHWSASDTDFSYKFPDNPKAELMPSTRTRSSRTTSSRVERSGGEKVIEKPMETTEITYRTSGGSATGDDYSTGRRSRYEMSSSSLGGRSGSGYVVTESTRITSGGGASASMSAGSASAAGASSGSAGGGGTYTSKVSMSRSSRSRSPLAVRREEEKDELADLNDRLAMYIEFVRHLGMKNQDLVKKFKTMSKVEAPDVDSIKALFEDELQALRRALDEMGKERALLEVENRKMRAEWDDMKSKLSRKEMEVRGLERKVEQYEKELAQMRGDHDRYTSIKHEFDMEVKQITGIKSALEKESVARQEAESKVTNLQKEIDFLNALYKEEKSKWISRSIEIEEEVEERTKDSYDSRLAIELQRMREQTAEEMRAYKMEIENTFNNKFAGLKVSSDRSMGDVSRSREELYTMRKRYDEVNGELAKKQMEVDSLLRRVSELEKMLESERGDFEAQMRIFREENESLRMEMEKRFKEFNVLLAIKINLDNEIHAYRTLLESEELRCNLTHEEREAFVRSARLAMNAEDADEEELVDLDLGSGGGSSASSRTAGHYSVKASTSGAIEISKCDVGQSIVLHNISREDVVVGGWQLRYEADGTETVYKFPRNLTIKAQESCTVWSSESHTTHDPPHDLVMKGLTFFSGNKVKICLMNKDEEMAVCEMEREFARRTTAITSGSSRRIVSSTREGRAGSEERCSVM